MRMIISLLHLNYTQKRSGHDKPWKLRRRRHSSLDRTLYKNQDPTHRAQRSISFSNSESISPAPLKDNRPRGKHSRLRWELSLAISNSSAVCSIVHQEPEHTNHLDSDLPDLTCTSEDSDDKEDEDDDSFFGCPSK